MPTFSDIVDAADELSVDEQETLMEILRRRIADKNRAQILRDVEAARSEIAAGQGSPASPNEIMDKVRR